MNNSNDTPTEAALLAALGENFAHARHQEDLRERQNNIYWLIWGGILSVAYAGDNTPKDVPLLFTALVVISWAVLLTSLKWTSEFGNHITAAARIAEKLRLNIPSSTTGQPNPGIRSPLPYGEFKGVMALPLRANLVLNVGFWIPSVHCFGLASAVAIAAYGFAYSLLEHGVGQEIALRIAVPELTANDLVALLIGIVCGIIAFLVGLLVVCPVMFKLMVSQVKARTPAA